MTAHENDGLFDSISAFLRNPADFKVSPRQTQAEAKDRFYLGTKYVEAGVGVQLICPNGNPEEQGLRGYLKPGESMLVGYFKDQNGEYNLFMGNFDYEEEEKHPGIGLKAVKRAIESSYPSEVYYDVVQGLDSVSLQTQKMGSEFCRVVSGSGASVEYIPEERIDVLSEKRGPEFAIKIEDSEPKLLFL